MTPWAVRRRRAEVLRDRHPFAAELLTVYLALVDVWEDAWELAQADRPEPARLTGWAAERVVPRVVKATEASAPEPLAAAARDLVEAGGAEAALAGWLADSELSPVERYLARASLVAPLVALDTDAGAACADDPAPRGGRRCPRCGGPPQVSFRSRDGDPLVAGGRRLGCARCSHDWTYSAGSCPSCGELSGSQRTIYAERRAGPVVGREPADADGGDPPTFPHLRVDACASCHRYLIDVDLGRDGAAVPDVDELAALPLDLYAAEQGLAKITPNLMGF
jgi:formate dehydrogenase maturation protein FdhE